MNQIHFKEDIQLPDKVLLVDDVITTGATLKAAIQSMPKRPKYLRIYACSSVRKSEAF